MVVVSPSLPCLDTAILSLYSTKDTLVGNLPVMIFHGPSTTTNSTHNSSRIQAHIFSISGYTSFPRLTISPTSPLYAAVHHLPEDKQGDETCRGLAISLMKYYAEMPVTVKRCLTDLVSISHPDGHAPAIFDESHAATLAANMVKAENSSEVAYQMQTALAERTLSWTDMDVILPMGCTNKAQSQGPLPMLEGQPNGFDEESCLLDYGQFTEIVKLFGSPSFLPTSKIRRAPSRPTAMSKTRTLAQDHKESLKRDMKELLETEKSYVMKIYDLSSCPAASYSYDAKNKQSCDVNAGEKEIFKLFPESLTQILEINAEFLDTIRLLLGDVDGDPELDIGYQMACVNERDPTGVDAFARTLLQFVPRFREPYQKYLTASAEFSKILSDAFKGRQSGFLEALRLTGEQRLRSWLIEPVQRLPRYSLFIDSMVNQLPASHPAMTKFLKCKDMLADICALENDGATDMLMNIKHLRDLVSKWPDSIAPDGRILSAVDAVEVSVPYMETSNAIDGFQSILLLFPGHALVLRKLNGEALSARGLLAELDRPRSAPTNAGCIGGIQQQLSLSLAHSFRLEETRFTESCNGRILSIACVRKASKAPKNLDKSTNYATTIRQYCLLGAYEGKAGQWNEEVARARIEHRFPEKMRENGQWGLRVMAAPPGGIGTVAAIFEDDSCADPSLRRKAHGRIQIIVHDRGKLGEIFPSELVGDVEIQARITILSSPMYRLEIKALQGFESTDNVDRDNLVVVLNKRLSNLQRLHQQPLTLEAAQSHVSYNQKVAEAIRPRFPLQRSLSRSRLRPYSPVKALTNFLGNSFGEPSSPRKQNAFHIEQSGKEQCESQAPTLPHPTFNSGAQKLEDIFKSRVKIVDAPEAPAIGSSQQLETTFNTYIVAMHSRCGNIVGKILRARQNADELKVNELYNTLIEDPSRHQAAAEVSVDILFAAFEKFLSHEWKERMGPVLPKSLLVKMQSLFDSTLLSEIPEHFKPLLLEMTPQNRRTFSSSIRLLFDLLNASSNDGDRGALTAAFAEALVDDGDPLEYISLLDRLVDDVDTLFEDSTPVEVVTAGLQSGSLQRNRSINTGSMSSTGSSLRKRFGFGILTRENSKSEPESRVGQVWRSLSKKTSQERDALSSTMSRSILSRSRSIDNDARKPLPLRPISQDRPKSSSSDAQAVLTPHYSPESIRAENTMPVLPHQERRKRRSSLSDLKDFQSLGQPSFGRPVVARKFEMHEASTVPYQTVRKDLNAVSPGKLQRSPKPASRLPSPSRKENIAPFAPAPDAKHEWNNQDLDGVSITSLSPRKRDHIQSNTRTIKFGLQDRSNLPDEQDMLPRPTRTFPQKMKIQSPQKIRERLERERKAMQDMTPGLQADLSEVREELALLRKGPNTPIALGSLSGKVTSLEEKLANALEETAKRTTSIQKDLESSLTVSEKKCKSLDELYRESNAENELLYERFNSELGKVLARVKRDESTGVLQAKLQEAQDDAARLRKENQRLKREVLGLRSQLMGEDK